MARKGKYTAAMVTEIVKLLEDGNTDSDTYALVGISAETFYNWLETKPEFLEAVTHARGVARQRAVDAYRSAMKSQQQKTAKEVTFTETRLRKSRDKDGNAIDVPYTYTKTTVEKSVAELAPDWRAAESYLKRRDPQNWAETYIIKVTPEQLEILKAFGINRPSDAFEQLIQKLDAEAKAEK